MLVKSTKYRLESTSGKSSGSSRTSHDKNLVSLTLSKKQQISYGPGFLEEGRGAEDVSSVLESITLEVLLLLALF